jgi:hypothetical protein
LFGLVVGTPGPPGPLMPYRNAYTYGLTQICLSMSHCEDSSSPPPSPPPPGNTWGRRKIRLIESNAKCHYLKKLTCKGTLRQLFYLSEARSLAPSPYSPSPYTLYTCIQRMYLFTQERGAMGRGELTREKVRAAIVHQAGRKYQRD